MNIAIDIDDTLTESFDYFLPFVAEYFGVSEDELREKNISYSNLPSEWKAKEIDFAKTYYDRVVAKTTFKDDAAWGIAKLKELGHNIIIITGRTEAFYTDPYLTTEEELKNGGIIYDKLICTLDKKSACKQEKVLVLVDDLVANCKSALEEGVVPILFTSKANASENTGYTRVNNWTDVVNAISYIERGYPDKVMAEYLLRCAEEINPGPWGNHCRTAAHCAEKIALACNGMNAEKAYVLGLLHDIGRRYGVRHLGHVSDGYTYMLSLGYDAVAKICLTHSFNNQSTEQYIGQFDTTDEELNLINESLNSVIMDDYDKLIQLCDALAGSEGVLDIEERMNDVKKRYGSYPQEKWDSNIKLKEFFEMKGGKDIYRIVEKETYRP